MTALLITLGALGYIVVGGVVSAIVTKATEDPEWGTAAGIFWPVAWIVGLAITVHNRTYARLTAPKLPRAELRQ